MVVFTCGHCGESVQKPKVEKHYLTKCRNRNPNLSCMDCFKDFLGNDYETHTKCITEEERYSGKGFMAKEKKGEKKQTAWVEMLQSVLEEQRNAPKNVVRIIETISKHNNVPRKKPKFVNFVKNVCGHKTNQNDIDQAWDFISVKLSALSNITQNKDQNNKNETAINGDKEAKKNGEADENDDKPENNTENGETEDTEVQNEKTEIQNEESEKQNGNEAVDEKKLSKKQRKEEKKRQKYEAALQSASELAPSVEAEDETEGKKGKKKKNRNESISEEVENTDDKKQKKRKRQDTVNSVNGVPETVDNGIEMAQPEVVKEKLKKKKKVGGEDENEESICLHDQNVAKIEEMSMNSDKFNWHAVIMSVLEKKGNEVPFKRLQKKVLSEYSEATGRDVDDRIAEKFIKKLKSAPNVRVDKNRVLLIE